MRPDDPASAAGAGRAAQPDPVDVDAQQLGVVVEHFLEMRNRPVAGHRIAGEAAVELVEQRRAGHGRDVRAASPAARCAESDRARPGMPDQEFEHGRRREFRRAAEAADGSSWPVLGGFSRTSLVIRPASPEERRPSRGSGRRRPRGARRGRRACGRWRCRAPGWRRWLRRRRGAPPRPRHRLEHLAEGRTARHAAGAGSRCRHGRPGRRAGGRRTSASRPRR